MPVQIDADFTKIVFFGKADGRLLFGQRNFTQANFRRSRRRWWRSDWSWLIRDVDAIVLSERFQAAIEALGDKTKFPVTIPAIDFTEDQSGFLTAAQFYLTTDQRGIATFNLYGQMIQGGNCGLPSQVTVNATFCTSGLRRDRSTVKTLLVPSVLKLMEPSSLRGCP
jgi:hypothetical protein